MKKIKIKRYGHSSTGNYSFQKKLPAKDNRTIYDPLPGDRFYDGEISISEAVADAPNVRVPKLKRKTAWKRFYKLFPHLKGMKIIHGWTSSYGGNGYYNHLNKSTIKLKKIKK